MGSFSHRISLIERHDSWPKKDVVALSEQNTSQTLFSKKQNYLVICLGLHCKCNSVVWTLLVFDLIFVIMYCLFVSVQVYYQ